MSCTLRRTWPDEPHRPDDYVFRHNGVDVGRCYLMHVAGNEAMAMDHLCRRARQTRRRWRAAGHSETLEQAKAQFRKSFDAMIVAGVVKIP